MSMGAIAVVPAMPGYLAILLHAHLPFVRHPEYERFLEESWLYEAIGETYLPLVALLLRWQYDGVPARLALTVSPTLCSMLDDPLLRARYERRLRDQIDLAEREVFRNHWDNRRRALAEAQLAAFRQNLDLWRQCGGDLVAAFRQLQDAGRIEIVTCAATHAVLPLLASHRSAVRGQVLTSRDHYRAAFGRDPIGIWLPECGYCPEIEPVLREAGLRWFVVDSHGLLHGSPRPQFKTFAPVFTPDGLAAFGRDPASARQVWSRQEGYPGDPRCRDFYRDVGFDLDFEYVRGALPSPDQRGFTGIKYHAIGTNRGDKPLYDPQAARAATAEHAAHFVAARIDQLQRAAPLVGVAPILIAPYDAELFGHWWHEGLDFLDAAVRALAGNESPVRLATPTDYLRQFPTHQVVRPGASTWGEEGHLRVWLNEKNAWVQPLLRGAEKHMTLLATRDWGPAGPSPIEQRALCQAARELLLAQASDWPFILHTGTNPSYARNRIAAHLGRFANLAAALDRRAVDPTALGEIEALDPIFPAADWNYWHESL
jgi:1,4-alpha-glucan branching enzyme